MEDKFVYMTSEQIEERKAKVAAIEGLAEIRAAIKASENGDVNALRAKYPRASVYLEAERWIGTEDPIKVRLGSRALEKILDGEDPEAVMQEMRNGLDAFYMAQEG